jgi:hypothetical protein
MGHREKNNLLPREGSDQSQRFIRALDPSSVQLNDFSLKEWMQFAYRFAAHVNYFKGPGDEPSGNWEAFFKEGEELEDFLSRVGKENNITPHLALFTCFIWLLEFTKKRFNRLTKRHLDFYYREVLHMEKLPATPDKVHLLFELAKKVTEEEIEEGTGMDGGKDAGGQKRVYRLTDTLIANRAVVTRLKSLYNDPAHATIKAAEIANSHDGKGSAFPNDEIKWWPFGYYEAGTGTEATGTGLPELDDAKLGFAVASHLLKLQEGERAVRLDITFSTPLNGVTTDALVDNLEVWCSGEKGWLGPYQPAALSTGVTGAPARLSIGFILPREEPAVVPYDAAVHGEQLDTGQPVCRVLFRTGNEPGYTLYRRLADNEVKALSMHVDVQGVSSLELENDTGVLNAAKPFYPFGTQPVKRSGFYIGYPELFAKEWENVTLNILWKNTPEKRGYKDAFKELYYAYRTDNLSGSSTFTYLTAIYQLLEPPEEKEEKIPNPYLWSPAVPDPANLIVKGDDHFKANIEVKYKEEWEITADGRDQVLFTETDKGFISEFNIDNAGYEAGKNGPFRVSLNQSFYHELYPRLYALAFASDKKDALIPNAPYTPMIESIHLDYSASAAMNLNSSEADFHGNEVSLFHEHPFGQVEEHPHLKQLLPFLNEEDRGTHLVPSYPAGGELYIGLEEAEPSRVVSLLVQLLEGSENPEVGTLAGKQKVTWSALCQNHWKPLDSNHLIVNDTRDFLKSGIVKFSLPKEANRDNTRLTPGFTWIRAQARESYDAVCKAIAIHAQAAAAQFSDNGNEWSHLQNGLEANSITKPVVSLPAIKKVIQPYPSFGGKPRETDDEQYRRVSERLRHKNRAITVWDYEHLVLQQFPEIYKAKCISHATLEPTPCFLTPGHILVVVIPDMVNNHLFDFYRPRVSKAKLSEIKEFLNKRNGMHVKVAVVNPEYEEVTVDLQVRFHKGYDEHFHLKKLNEDITRFLSPHAFREADRIEFGAALHRSTLTHWVEGLPYVDWVKELKLMKGGSAHARVIPSNPAAILVSAKQHRLAVITGSPEESIESE